MSEANRKARVGVIGGGSWATAIAKMLLTNEQKINWYIRKDEVIERFIRLKHNPSYRITSYNVCYTKLLRVENEAMVMNIAETCLRITEKYHIPYVFKASYRKANRSRLDSFAGIGDEPALKMLAKVRKTFNIPVVTDIHSAEEAAMAAES